MIKSHSGFVKAVALLLCAAVIITSFCLGNIGLVAEAEGETVTITVNYVYESNNAMVAQPYRAQIAKNTEFVKSIEVPKLLNYSIPSDLAEGLSENVTLNQDADTKKYTLAFNINSAESDITVTLYYVAGTAKYTVYHYYQNLENDKYDDEEPKIIELVGDIDAYTEAVANNKPGYHCKGIPQTMTAIIIRLYLM